MNKAKGYVVRYERDGMTVYVAAPPWLDDHTIAPSRDSEGAVFDTLAKAVAAQRFPRTKVPVRIYAVAEDGTETPLPTYEEALAILEETRAETCTPMALADLPAFMQRALSESVDLGREVERLCTVADKARALVAAADACDREAESHPSSRSSAPLGRYIRAMKALSQSLADAPFCRPWGSAAGLRRALASGPPTR